MRVYYLMLNDMRGPCESLSTAAVSFDKELLKEYYKEMMVDPYIDYGMDYYGNSHNFRKFFKKESKWEWFNPIGWTGRIDYFDFSDSLAPDYLIKSFESEGTIFVK